MRSPHMMSSAHLVMYGHTSKPWDPTSFCNLLIRISLFSENTSTKLSRILKWKAGVIIFLWVCHFCPGENPLAINVTFLFVLRKREHVFILKRTKFMVPNLIIPEPKQISSRRPNTSGKSNRILLRTCGCQQACAKPVLHELVQLTFVQVFTAPKHHLKEETRSVAG